MPLSLKVMALLGVLFGLLGLPTLLRPAALRGWLGLKNTPQMAYILRIVGTMLVAMGLILLVFSTVYWKAGS